MGSGRGSRCALCWCFLKGKGRRASKLHSRWREMVANCRRRNAYAYEENCVILRLFVIIILVMLLDNVTDLYIKAINLCV